MGRVREVGASTPTLTRKFITIIRNVMGWVGVG